MKMIVWLTCLLLVFAHQGDALSKRRIKLSSGYEMPVFGLATASIDADRVERAVSSALEVGYRHIDTAFDREREAAVGRAIGEWLDEGNARQRVFVTAKLPSHANRPESVEKYLKSSLERLGLDYVDMYLIHKDEHDALEDDVDRVAIWKEMERQVSSGRVRSIGLSNFDETQVLAVYENATIKPSNLQVESHLYRQRPRLRKLCKDNRIVMTARAPLGSSLAPNSDLPPAIEYPLVKELAKKYAKTASQILLRHAFQTGLAVVLDSTDPARQREYVRSVGFALDDEEMRRLDAVDVGETGRVQ